MLTASCYSSQYCFTFFCSFSWCLTESVCSTNALPIAMHHQTRTLFLFTYAKIPHVCAPILHKYNTDVTDPQAFMPASAWHICRDAALFSNYFGQTCYYYYYYLFVRPPDIHVGGLTFYLDSFLSRHLPAELAERNSTKTGHMLGRECDLKMHAEIWGILPSTNRGPKTTFLTISQLYSNFNGLYLRNKTRYRQSASAFTTTRGLLYRPETTWALVHKQLKLGPPFIPTLRKFCILLHCQASQTGIIKRNSTKLWRTVSSKLC